ncbi:MAG: hypothetical protein ACLPN2_04840 [Terriglobales bacterium]
MPAMTGVTLIGCVATVSFLGGAAIGEGDGSHQGQVFVAFGAEVAPCQIRVTMWRFLP